MDMKVKAAIIDIKVTHIMEVVDITLQDQGHDIKPIRQAIKRAILLGVWEVEAD